VSSASHWRTVAARFEDATTFFPVLRQPEIWRLVNLTEDSHPIHVHLDAFQVLDRHPAAIEPRGDRAARRRERDRANRSCP
jgi:FtsP/CotA-like multicopper oxidase with cupredoxin domain